MYVYAHVCSELVLYVIRRFLANLYAAEATIHLGLLQEAANFLNPDDIMDISLSVGSTATGKVELQSESPRECKGSACFRDKHILRFCFV